MVPNFRMGEGEDDSADETMMTGDGNGDSSGDGDIDRDRGS